jgi:hypothetical protein
MFLVLIRARRKARFRALVWAVNLPLTMRDGPNLTFGSGLGGWNCSPEPRWQIRANASRPSSRSHVDGLAYFGEWLSQAGLWACQSKAFWPRSKGWVWCAFVLWRKRLRVASD